MSDYRVAQQGKRIRYPELSRRERELEVKNERLQGYVTALLQRNAQLAGRVRELEASR
jgi:hypothetical protein